MAGEYAGSVYDVGKVRVLIGLRAEEAEVVVDQQRGGVEVGELCEHRYRLLSDWAAEVNCLVVFGQLFELRHCAGDRDLSRTIEDHTHRASLIVLGDQHDRETKVRVMHCRRCD